MLFETVLFHFYQQYLDTLDARILVRGNFLNLYSQGEVDFMKKIISQYLLGSLPECLYSQKIPEFVHQKELHYEYVIQLFSSLVFME